MIDDKAREFFWSKIDKSGGVYACWPWTGYINKLGYGTHTFVDKDLGKNVTVGAHRFSFELLNGKQDAQAMDHLCRNTICCNPRHLDPVSYRINTLRGISPAAKNAVKTHCKKGHPLEGENLITKAGNGRPESRACRICVNEIHKAYRARKAGRQLEKEGK